MIQLHRLFTTVLLSQSLPIFFENLMKSETITSIIFIYHQTPSPLFAYIRDEATNNYARTIICIDVFDSNRIGKLKECYRDTTIVVGDLAMVRQMQYMHMVLQLPQQIRIIFVTDSHLSPALALAKFQMLRKHVKFYNSILLEWHPKTDQVRVLTMEPIRMDSVDEVNWHPNYRLNEQLFNLKCDNFNKTELMVKGNMQLPEFAPTRSGTEDGQEMRITGSLVYFIQMIERYMNATISVIIANDLEFTDLQWNNAEETLRMSTNYLNAIVAPIMAHEQFSSDSTYPYDVSRYTIVVPIIDSKQSLWTSIVQSTTIFYVWMALIAIGCIARFVIKKYNDVTTGERNRSMVFIVLDTWCLSLGGGPGWSHHRIDRLVALFVSVCGIVFGITCSGYLFNELTISRKMPLVNSIEEMLQCKAIETIWMPQDFYASNTLQSKVNQKLLPIQYLHMNEEPPQDITTMAFIMSEGVIDILLSLDSTSMFQKIPQSFVNELKFFCVKFRPIMNRLNILQQRLVEQGLMRYFERRNKYFMRLKEVPLSAQRESAAFEPITFLNMQMVMVIVMFGWILSVVVFLVEKTISYCCGLRKMVKRVLKREIRRRNVWINSTGKRSDMCAKGID